MIEDYIERYKKLIATLSIAVVLLYFYNSGALMSILAIIPGPEGVDCSLYGAVANGGVRVEGQTQVLTTGVGTQSVLGAVAPNSWISYNDFSKYRIGYQWVRVDPKTPVIQAVLVDRTTGRVVEGINLQVRISRPTMQEVNVHGDPVGRAPTQIDWYSFEGERTQTGDTITWKHYEAYVVPVDFVIELSVRPTIDLNTGDFQNFDLWFVIDTVAWVNAFAQNQYALLKDQPPQGATISAYNYRGGFPIWAWVGTWDPWVVSGRNGDPNRFYDPADLSSEETSELQQRLQLMPSYRGSEISLYTQPGYLYPRTFASDIIKDPELLKQMISSSIPGLPDPRFASTVYFPITLINYGALKREGGWWITYWHKEYYPTSYLRVRCLYAIYGEWTYLWTQSEAQKQQYTWENRNSTITGQESWWNKFLGGLGGWFTSPWTVLWAGIFGTGLLLVTLIILAIFAPGFLSAIASLIKRRKREE